MHFVSEASVLQFYQTSKDAGQVHELENTGVQYYQQPISVMDRMMQTLTLRGLRKWQLKYMQ